MVDIIVEVEGFKSTLLKINRPKWIDVYKHYPKINAGTLNENDEPAVSVFKRIFGEDYDGNAIGKHNYWNHAKSVHFWELK